jgi:hypothetical protein
MASYTSIYIFSIASSFSLDLLAIEEIDFASDSNPATAGAIKRPAVSNNLPPLSLWLD